VHARSSLSTPICHSAILPTRTIDKYLLSCYPSVCSFDISSPSTPSIQRMSHRKFLGPRLSTAFPSHRSAPNYHRLSYLRTLCALAVTPKHRQLSSPQSFAHSLSEKREVHTIRQPVHCVSPLESAVTPFSPLTPLESAVTQKHRGGGDPPSHFPLATVDCFSVPGLYSFPRGTRAVTNSPRRGTT